VTQRKGLQGIARHGLSRPRVRRHGRGESGVNISNSGVLPHFVMWSTGPGQGHRGNDHDSQLYRQDGYW
jgi:hypothetical protein